MTINISASPAKFYKTGSEGVEINMSSDGSVITMALDTGGIGSQEFVNVRPEKPTLKLRQIEWCHPQDGTLYHGVILATEFWRAGG